MVIRCHFLYTKEVFGSLRLPAKDGIESWYPTSLDELSSAMSVDDDDNDDSSNELRYDTRTHRIYHTLVIRMAELQRIIKFMALVRVDEKAALQKRKWAEQNLDALYAWLDAHLMICMAIDELGYVPTDDSEEMGVLLECYSPDVHMAFTESELPDMSREIRRCGFISKRENSRKDDPIIESMEKAQPERCLSREAAMKCADVSALNSSYFAWIKLLLAAMYLGVYHTSNYRGGWRYRWSVYRLFFYLTDRRLQPYCRAKKLPDGAGEVLGGTPAFLAREYDLNDLHDSLGIDQVSTFAARSTTPKSTRTPRGRSRLRMARVKKVLTTIKFRHYQTIVRLTHRAEMSDNATRRRSRSAPPPVSINNSNASPTNKTAADDSDVKPTPKKAKKKAAPKLRDGAMRNLTSVNTPADVLRQQGLTIDYDAMCADEDFKQGLFVANTIGRLGVEKNRGQLYFEQRREVYMAHATAAQAAQAAREPDKDPPPINEPPVPLEMGEVLKYKDAAKRMIADDRRMPSDEELQRDAIIFHAISSVIERRAEGGANPEKEYTYQNVISLALRLFLMFGLERWNESVLTELCARTSTLDDDCPRTDWATWQLGNCMIADVLRSNLDQLYNAPCKLGAFLTTYAPYEAMKESTGGDTERTAIINNLYTLEKETYLAASLRVMTTMLNAAGYADERLTHTPPTETPIIMRHLLMYWRYPRYAPPIDVDAIRRNKKKEVDLSDPRAEIYSGGLVQSKQQLRATILPAQASFLIEPTTRLPGEHATHAEIAEQFVRPARFPLKLFHVDDVAIMEFNRHRHDYHMAPSDLIIEDFLATLARRDMYQFLVFYMYLQAIANHLSNRTWPLPRHITDHQTRTLRSYYCIPDNRVVPTHFLKTLVCMGCQRCAAVMPTLRKQQAAAAGAESSLGAGIDIGCDHVRWVTETDDDTVFAAIRKRGGLLMPRASMLPAESWTKVLHHRARTHRHAYDRFTMESTEETDELLAAPARFGYLPPRPTEEQIVEQSHSIFGLLFDEEFIEQFAKPTDVRQAMCNVSRPGAPLHLVASGRGKLGELDFDERLCTETNRRIMQFVPPSSKMRSFQIWGHSLTDRDRRYDTVRWVDATQRMKAESKKSKQLDKSKEQIDGIVQQDEKDSKMNTFGAKRRRDAQSMARVAQCAREQMLEVDLYGRALAQEQIFGVGRTQQQADDDFLMACCDCLGKVHGSRAYPIADRIVCKPCYIASQTRGGVVAKRSVRGESTKSIATARLSALSADSAALMRIAPNQRLLSPSFKTLHDCVVPNGTPCAMDRCKRTKSDLQLMYGLQVLRDIDVGNEAFGYIFFCKKHAALYSALFKSPFVVPLSSIKIFMLEGVRKFDTNLTNGNYLDRYLRSAAQSAHIGMMERHRVDVAKKQKTLANKKKKQQKEEALAAALEASEAKSATHELGRKTTTSKKKQQQQQQQQQQQ